MEDRTCGKCGAPAEVVDHLSMYGTGPTGDVELVMEKVQCLAISRHLFVVEVIEVPAPWVVLQIEAQEKADREARHRRFDV